MTASGQSLTRTQPVCPHRTGSPTIGLLSFLPRFCPKAGQKETQTPTQWHSYKYWQDTHLQMPCELNSLVRLGYLSHGLAKGSHYSAVHQMPIVQVVTRIRSCWTLLEAKAVIGFGPTARPGSRLIAYGIP